ncbi:VOC family protein [Streptomyces sp. NPDC091215]|uniref:VOC family protein n=1 Tax=Streptomyces sp. NPDC091215 TaxID=3155192 RepID=UPI0034319920
MRQRPVLFALPLLLAVACGAPAATGVGGDSHSSAGKAVAAQAIHSVGRVASATRLTMESLPAPTGTIVMVKLYVGTLDAAERFYGRVFGAKFAVAQGENVPIVTFPNGGPGLVLIKKGPHDGKKEGGFIIQVPDLDFAKRAGGRQRRQGPR